MKQKRYFVILVLDAEMFIIRYIIQVGIAYYLSQATQFFFKI